MALFSQKNRASLQQVVIQEFEGNGNRLNTRQLDRLERTLDHYVEAVYEAQGDQQLPLLNREIVKVTGQDFSKYLQRQNIIQQAVQTPARTIVTQANPLAASGPQYAITQGQQNQQGQQGQQNQPQLYLETGQRYEVLQNERRENNQPKAPPMPDFRIALEEDGPTSVDLYEQAKKAREEEALRQANSAIDGLGRMDSRLIQGLNGNTTSEAMLQTRDPGLMKRINADDSFRLGQASQNKSTDIILSERRNTVRPLDMPLIVPPDGRELVASLVSNPGPRGLGDANSDPTLTIPSLMSNLKSNLPQDYLIRQESRVTYREIENNVFVYSGDRDWLKNIKDNRYSFSVIFDPAANGQGLNPQVRVQERFKNIVRIELIKAILPIEGLQTLVQKTADLSNNTNYQVNVLSMPYVSVSIPELENNNYGSDNFLDRAFGVLQYDANWYSDPGTNPSQVDSRGFTAFIPKFLKCQKVYAPAPLSTLQRLTINLLQPDGELLSPTADTFDISAIFVSCNPIGGSLPFGVSPYNGGTPQQPDYFMIETTNYFSRFQVAVGDRIRIAGYKIIDDVYDPDGYNIPGALQSFTTWINQEQGHLVAQIAYGNDTGITANGSNTIGYANYIIIQNQFADPLTGSTAIYQFGGPNGNIGSNLYYNVNKITTPRRLINLSRQTNMVFRIITRELDGTTQLRPDNT
jgi:hypothetical protein